MPDVAKEGLKELAKLVSEMTTALKDQNALGPQPSLFALNGVASMKDGGSAHRVEFKTDTKTTATTELTVQFEFILEAENKSSHMLPN